jgi:putative transposase
VIDGAKALRRGVLDVFDHPVIAKVSTAQSPQCPRSAPEEAALGGGHADARGLPRETVLSAQAQLETLAGELDRTHPGAAASLREGLDETLTVLHLGVPPTLARSLRSTNCVESLIGICRDHSRSIKR